MLLTNRQKNPESQQATLAKTSTDQNQEFWEYVILKTMSKIEIAYLPTKKLQKYVIPANSSEDNLSDLSLDFLSNLYSEVLLPGNASEICYIDHTKYSDFVVDTRQGGKSKSSQVQVTDLRTFRAQFSYFGGLNKAFITINTVLNQGLPSETSAVKQMEKMNEEIDKFYRPMKRDQTKTIEDKHFKEAFRIPKKIFVRLNRQKNENVNMKTEGLIFLVYAANEDNFYRAEFVSFNAKTGKDLVKYHIIDYGGNDDVHFSNCYFLHKSLCHFSRTAIEVNFDFFNLTIKEGKRKEANEVLRNLMGFDGKFFNFIFQVYYKENEKIEDGPLTIVKAEINDVKNGRYALRGPRDGTERERIESFLLIFFCHHFRALFP